MKFQTSIFASALILSKALGLGLALTGESCSVRRKTVMHLLDSLPDHGDSFLDSAFWKKNFHSHSNCFEENLCTYMAETEVETFDCCL